MKKLFIFRHGQTNFNKGGYFQGCGIDSELNNLGIEQAKSLITKLKDAKIEIIYSSPLKRSLQTARIVSQGLSIKVKIVDNLREASFGIAEGVSKSELIKKYPEIIKSCYSSNEKYLDFGFENGETKRQVQQRIYKTIESLCHTNYDNIGISTHGFAMVIC